MKLTKMLIGTCVLGMVVAVGTAPALASHGSDDSRQSTSGKKASKKSQTRIRLIGRSGNDDTGAKATAKYESRNDRRKFDVEVQNAVPGTSFDVSIEGRVIAKITANSFGVAKLELRPTPDDSNERPIPSDFPQLKAGDKVKIGNFMVVLASRA